MQVVSRVACLEEVGVQLGTEQSNMCQAGLKTTFSENLKETPAARGVPTWEERLESGPGPHCLVSPPHPSRPHPACHPRDRDYDDIDDDDPFNPQARRIAAHNPPRGQLRSFCSYSSGLGSQGSLHPTQTISNAPVSEYMYGGASPNTPGWGSVACPGLRGAGSAGEGMLGSRGPGRGRKASEASWAPGCSWDA